MDSRYKKYTSAAKNNNFEASKGFFGEDSANVIDFGAIVIYHLFHLRLVGLNFTPARRNVFVTSG